jgi:hypothetical protein
MRGWLRGAGGRVPLLLLQKPAYGSWLPGRPAFGAGKIVLEVSGGFGSRVTLLSRTRKVEPDGAGVEVATIRLNV